MAPPRNACISGETRRGFIIPLGSRFFVSVAGFAAAETETERKTRRLAGAASLSDGGEEETPNDGVSRGRKVENAARDTAIFSEIFSQGF